MPGDKALIVFISYARKDAAELAQQLRHHLTEAGHKPWLDTARIAGGAVWTTDIEQAIDTCDVALALLFPGSYQSDICRAEQLRALRKGKRVIPILTKAGTDIPLHLETKNYRDLTSSKSKRTQLGLLTKDLQNPKSGIRLDPAFQHTYVTAPPLPRNYLPRPDALEALRSALLTEEPGPGIALTALKGMGGIGKTVLAQALCYDEVVQQAFPDGVIWITAGKESADDLVTRLREVGKGLNDDLAGYDTQLGSINSYRTILKKKVALIVVDDVWNARDIEPFRADSPSSRLLFTTHDGEIANAVGAGQVVAGLLTPTQSRLLLAQWAKLRPEDLPPESADVIRETGHLPWRFPLLEPCFGTSRARTGHMCSGCSETLTSPDSGRSFLIILTQICFARFRSASTCSMSRHVTGILRWRFCSKICPPTRQSSRSCGMRTSTNVSQRPSSSSVSRSLNRIGKQRTSKARAFAFMTCNSITCARSIPIGSRSG